MEKLRSLSNMGLEVNGAGLGQWPEAIGRFVINFGSIELFSYQYLHELEPTREAFNQMLGQPLRKRVDRIIDLIATLPKLSGEEKEVIRDLWRDVREGAELRNRIAHNPVVPSWKPESNPESDPPDVMGIPDMKALRDSNLSDSLPLEELNRLNDIAVAIGQQIHAAFLKIKRT